jgi:hypothetical protein
VKRCEHGLRVELLGETKDARPFRCVALKRAGDLVGSRPGGLRFWTERNDADPLPRGAHQPGDHSLAGIVHDRRAHRRIDPRRREQVGVVPQHGAVAHPILALPSAVGREVFLERDPRDELPALERVGIELRIEVSDSAAHHVPPK